MTVDARRSSETIGTQVQPPGESAIGVRELGEAVPGGGRGATLAGCGAGGAVGVAEGAMTTGAVWRA